MIITLKMFTVYMSLVSSHMKLYHGKYTMQTVLYWACLFQMTTSLRMDEHEFSYHYFNTG